MESFQNFGWRVARAVPLLLAILFAACVEGISTGPDDDEILAVVVEPSRAIIDVEGTVKLNATVFDGAGRVVQAQVVWTTSAPSIAVVDEDGLVRGVGPGSARISAQAEGKTGISEITVRLIESF
jgi:hypothetical protein